MHASAVVTAPLITNPISANSANGSSRYAVEHLSDDALLAGARSLVARSNQQLASLLAHLAEVEARGIHRTHACASLCAYCVYVLRMSEDTAFRYARAAKLARRFPVLFEQIAAGEIHLTGLILLGTHLSDENHREVLRLAKHRSKREIIQLVRRLDPLPDVPSHIEPLAGARHLVTNGTWGAFMQALNPVRELAPDHRPSSWLRCVQDAELAHPASREDAPPEAPTPTGAPQDRPARRVGSTETARPAPAAELGFEQAGALNRDPAGAGEVELRSNGEHEHEHEHTAPPLNAQRYCIQFTATQEYVDLVERARDLLSHAVPSRSLAEVHLRAMRALVVELEKRKFGARQSARTAAAASVEVAHEPRARSRSQRSDPERSWFGREVAETLEVRSARNEQAHPAGPPGIAERLRDSRV